MHSARYLNNIGVGSGQSIRYLSTLVRPGHPRFPRELHYHEDFLSFKEQNQLLQAALLKLDSMDSLSFKKRRKALQKSITMTGGDTLFFPDTCYPFEEVIGSFQNNFWRLTNL
jgi:hypothetical protein